MTQLRGRTHSSNLDNQIVSDSKNGAAYGYDLDGNTTTAQGVSLQYDDANRLIAYDDAAVTGLHLRFGYRPDGLRAWKQINNGPPVYFFYDGDRLTLEMTQSSNLAPVTRAYGWGATGLEQVDYPPSAFTTGVEYTLFYAFDPRGNVASRIKNVGQARDQVTYDAFGDLIGDWAYDGNGNWSFNDSDPVGWGGQWGAYTDVPGWAGMYSGGGSEQAGLILLTHRYYSPGTGRFLTRDPMGYEGGVNVYAYTRNNPVNKIDPSGFQALDSPDASFWAAMREKAWNKAAYYLNDLATSGGTKTVAFKRVAAAFLGSAKVRQMLTEAFIKAETTLPNSPIYRNASGGVICELQADNFLNTLAQHFPEVENGVAEKIEMQAANGGQVILNNGASYGHHIFIRIGNTVIDSLNKGNAESWEKWTSRFQVPLERVSIFGWSIPIPWQRVPFEQVYKLTKIETSRGD